MQNSVPQPLFDSHLHIIDPPFPLVANQGYLPQPFSVEDYRRATSEYQLCGGAVVSGSFQAFDQTYLLAALNKLGPDFVGVTQLPAEITDNEILSLDSSGVRAIRFNLKRGGSEDVSKLSEMAHRVHQLAGWHVELYLDSHHLPQLFDTLVSLPAVSIDHLGLNKAGLPQLLKLAERGVRVKATGFGRVDFAIEPALVDLYNANPCCLMFGTDLPSTRAPRPYLHSDYARVTEALGDEAAGAVFHRNALAFYRR